MFFKKKSYRVKMKGISNIEYLEGGKKLKLTSELMNDNGMVIYKNGLKRWAPPDDKVPISEEEQNRIRANISEEFMRNIIDVIWV